MEYVTTDEYAYFDGTRIDMREVSDFINGVPERKTEPVLNINNKQMNIILAAITLVVLYMVFKKG